MSNKRKLISATIMLLISIMMLASSTYAWFTMNKEVEVTNMTVQVKTSSNLLISKTNADDSAYGENLSDALYALLEPVSTIDGLTYYYTLDGAGDGHKIHGPDTDNPYEVYNETMNLTATDTFADKTKYDKTFNDAYGITTYNPAAAEAFKTAYGYLDYSFYLKAVSTAAGQKIVMNKCNLLYNGEVVTDYAWRVAVLMEETAANTETAEVGDLITILQMEDSENQIAGKAVNSPTTVDTVNNAATEAIIDNSIAVNSTKYYKVTVRLWIEGEDKSCTSEVYGTKTDNYLLDFGFIIDDETDGITQISSETE